VWDPDLEYLVLRMVFHPHSRLLVLDHACVLIFAKHVALLPPPPRSKSYRLTTTLCHMWLSRFQCLLSGSGRFRVKAWLMFSTELWCSIYFCWHINSRFTGAPASLVTCAPIVGKPKECSHSATDFCLLRSLSQLSLDSKSYATDFLGYMVHTSFFWCFVLQGFPPICLRNSGVIESILCRKAEKWVTADWNFSTILICVSVCYRTGVL